MSEETVRIMTERDFVVFLGQIAGKLRDTDWGPSTDDLSESLYGMTEHLDNTSSTDTRDGMTWDMIAVGIRALHGVLPKAFHTHSGTISPR